MTATISNSAVEQIIREQIPSEYHAQAFAWIAAHAAAQSDAARDELRVEVINTTMEQAARYGWCDAAEAALQAVFPGAPEMIERPNGQRPRWILRDGFDRHGIDRDGFNRDGFNPHSGYDRDGFNYAGFDGDGFNREGYDRHGYNRDGVDNAGRTKFRYDVEGWDADGFNREGRDRGGFDRDGFGSDGFNREGFDREGRNAYRFNAKGYDIDGFNSRNQNFNGYSRAEIEAMSEAQQISAHGRVIKPAA